MKKIVSLLSLILLTVSMSFAEETLSYDELNNEFTELNKVENYIQNHKGVTLSEIQSQNPNVLSNIDLSNENSAVVVGDLPANIPPFLWGCVLGVIGILLVYILSDNDKNLTKKAVIGCLVGWGAGLIIYFIAFGSLFAASSRL